MEGEPATGDGKPLNEGIGLFVFNEKQPGGVDYGPTDAAVVSWFFLDSDLYSELWSQVAGDQYSSCSITVTVGPVAFQALDWAWGVKAGSRLFIKDVSVAFIRHKPEPKDEPHLKRRFFG